ncbi:MAG: phosphotransferase enzyme family protein [Anaerolineales bacterium]
MRLVPGTILDAFQSAYTSDTSVMIPYAGGQESSDGTVYRFQGDKADQLLKIMHLSSEDTSRAHLHFDARMNFLAFLSREGVPVIQPLPSLKGNLYECIEDQSGLWLAYAMQRVTGKTMSPKVWDPTFVQNWGRTIGKLHHVTQNYPDWRYCIDPKTNEPFLTWESEWQSFYDMCREDDIQMEWQNIKVILDSLPIRRDCFGFIHNDPHLWNLRVEGSHVTLLDFDTAIHHWFINDIAIACQYILSMHAGGFYGPVHHREFIIDFLREFMIGYDQENELDHTWLHRLDTFFSYRRVLLYIIMEGWRESKPDLQRSWKEMILNHPPVLSSYDL